MPMVDQVDHPCHTDRCYLDNHCVKFICIFNLLADIIQSEIFIIFWVSNLSFLGSHSPTFVGFCSWPLQTL